MNEKVLKFKEGIFSLNTRRFGKIAELMIKELYNFHDPLNVAYDLLTKDGNKVEVKFSTVLRKCNSVITSKNVIKEIIASKLENRMLTFENAKKANFDCNIQQVKPSEFDVLYYGCFFDDKIMICKINSSEIINDSEIMYSNHQHRGNTGEGQFHINSSTMNTHMNKYLVEWLTYEELYTLFMKKASL